MKTRFIFAILAAGALLFSCQRQEAPAASSAVSMDDGAIGFGVYSSGTVTKGSIVEKEDIMGAATSTGIGVFAFYQPNNNGEKSDYTARRYPTPDFMYNQQVGEWIVETDTSYWKWNYSPLKYWPNTPNDQVSFFAYAPYKANTSWEDLELTSDSQGVIKKTFRIENCVTDQTDFLWASPRLNLGNASAGGEYGVDSKVQFKFVHALSQISFWAGVEQNTLGDTATAWTDSNTVITINSITLRGLHEKMSIKYYPKEDSVWYGGIGSQSITLTREENFGRYAVIDTSTYKKKGFKMLNDSSSFALVAPQVLKGGSDIEAIINYTVATIDTENRNNSSVVENTVSKMLYADGKLDTLEQGKAYKLNFLIGMNHVKFDVKELAGWITADTVQLDVPKNESGIKTYSFDKDTVIVQKQGTATVKLMKGSGTVMDAQKEDFTLTGTGITGITYAVNSGVVTLTTTLEATAGTDAKLKYAKDTVSLEVPIKLTPRFYLPGKFTVNSSGKKVRFSSGNLRAICTGAGAEDVSTFSWGFAVNQYDALLGEHVPGSQQPAPKSGNNKISNQEVGDTVDLFGWVGESGTLEGAATKYGISNSMTSAHYGNAATELLKSDWGEAFCQSWGIKPTTTWRTLLNDEWTYLLTQRPKVIYEEPGLGKMEKNRWGLGKISGVQGSGVQGIILLPDNWEHGTLTLPFNYEATDFTYNTFDKDEWSQMEAAGCVFLPGGSRRNASQVAPSHECCYWTSSRPVSDVLAYFFGVGDPGGTPNVGETSRYTGNSVRLVMDVQ